MEVPYACPQLGFELSGQAMGDGYARAIGQRLNADPVINQILVEDGIHETIGLELVVDRSGNVVFANMAGCRRIMDAQHRIFDYVSKLNYGSFSPDMTAVRDVAYIPIYSPDPRQIIVTNPAFNAPPLPPQTPAQMAKANASNIARWNSAMPTAFAAIWPAAQIKIETMPGLLVMPMARWKQKKYPATIEFVKPFQDALQTEFPSSKEQIRALLTWYGSGAGPWSGYPSYEDIAAQLLSNYPTSEIVQVVQIGHLSQVQMEGAARYLANDVELYDPSDTVFLTEAVKSELLAVALKTRDTDKIQRAENALSN